MAIPIRQQVITLSGLLLGVTTDVTCPTCQKSYADLRQESITIKRSGTPAPFVAPTWGQEKRRQEVASELRAMVELREAYGLDARFGATRCPHCRLPVREEPDPRVVGTEAWLVFGGILAAAAAAAAGGLASNIPQSTHAEAVDVAIRVGAVVFTLVLGLICALAWWRRRSASRARDRARTEPLPHAPNNSATPEQWEKIQRSAASIGVEAAAYWFAGGNGSDDAPIADADGLRTKIYGYLNSRHVLWIIGTSSKAGASELGCGRCGKRISPYWHSKCNHCGALFTEFLPTPK